MKIVLSHLKHFLRTRSNDAWRLIEFTPCEKQKYQVTFVTKNKNISFICIQLAHALFQTSRLISSITKILSLTHRKCRSYPIYEYFLLFYRRINLAVPELYRDQIFSYTICLDWLFIVDPIWLVWHTYISHWLTDSLTHWSVDPSITYSTRRLRGNFFTKK